MAQWPGLNNVASGTIDFVSGDRTIVVYTGGSGTLDVQIINTGGGYVNAATQVGNVNTPGTIALNDIPRGVQMRAVLAAGGTAFVAVYTDGLRVAT